MGEYSSLLQGLETVRERVLLAAATQQYATQEGLKAQGSDSSGTAGSTLPNRVSPSKFSEGEKRLEHMVRSYRTDMSKEADRLSAQTGSTSSKNLHATYSRGVGSASRGCEQRVQNLTARMISINRVVQSAPIPSASASTAQDFRLAYIPNGSHTQR